MTLVVILAVWCATSVVFGLTMGPWLRSVDVRAQETFKRRDEWRSIKK